MHRIAIFSFGRKSSQRCPNKMLRPFANTTLTDVVLAKLSRSRYPTFFAGYEREFRDRCDIHGVRFVQRTAESASVDEPITEILSFLRDEKFEHLLLINACLPLLRLSTIEEFVDECVAQGCDPAFGVLRRRNHFLLPDGTPLNFDRGLKTINTKIVQPVLEFAHAVYFFDRSYFFAHGRYWDWESVRYVELPDRYELIDIDAEEDFVFAEAMWRTHYLGGNL